MSISTDGDVRSRTPTDSDDAIVWLRSGIDLAGPSLDDLLTKVLRVACVAAPTAATGGLTMVDRSGRVRAGIAIDQTAWEIETVAYLGGIGPGPSAIRDRHAVQINDIAAVIDLYPVFARAALERAVLASLSLPVLIDDTAVGALTLYAESPAALDRHADSALACAELASAIVATRAEWG